MKFFKKNSYEIVKLFVDQFGISIFAMFLYFALSAISWSNVGNQLTATVCVSVFSILFYLALIYCVCWDLGSADSMKIENGHLEKQICKGLYLALFANAINFVLSGLSVLFSGLSLAFGGFEVAFTVFNIPLRFITAEYNGLLQGVFASLIDNKPMYWFCQSIGFFVLPILPIAVCTVGYIFGVNNKRIFKQSAKEIEKKKR